MLCGYFGHNKKRKYLSMYRKCKCNKLRIDT